MPCWSTFRRVHWRFWMAVFAVVFCFISTSAQQAISDQAVKAAYLYNFAKFVEWPAAVFSSSTSPIRLCLFRGDPLESDLKNVVQGKSIAGHPVTVISVRAQEEYRACHVLFLGPAQGRESKEILAGVHGTSVLTVGDTEQFAQDGGMIQFVLNQDRVQFRVNHRAAGQAQLNVSSRLLRVAAVVIE